MDSRNRIATRPLSPDEARQFVLELEHKGVDPSRISLTTERPHDPATTGRVDDATVRRPAQRAVAGVIVGLSVGLLLSLGAAAVGDLPISLALTGGAVAGAAIGGLAGLYSQLPMTAELADVDTGGLSVVTIDLTELEDGQVDLVDKLIREI